MTGDAVKWRVALVKNAPSPTSSSQNVALNGSLTSQGFSSDSSFNGKGKEKSLAVTPTTAKTLGQSQSTASSDGSCSTSSLNKKTHADRSNERFAARGGDANLAGAAAAQRQRFRDKRHASVKGTVLSKEQHRQEDADCGEQIAQQEVAKEAKDESDELNDPTALSSEVQLSFDQSQPFVYRHGNFAKRYHVDGMTRGVERDFDVWWRRLLRWFRRPTPAIRDPRDQNTGLFRNYDYVEDAHEVAGLSFRGWAAVVGSSTASFWFVSLLWLSSTFGWWLGWVPGLLIVPAQTAYILFLINLWFTLDERYEAGDWMVEVDRPRLFRMQDETNPNQRHPNMRDTKITHAAVYATVPVTIHTARPVGNTLIRGITKFAGPWYVYWNYHRFFQMLRTQRDMTIEIVLASHLLRTAQNSSARTYDEMLEMLKVSAGRIMTVNTPDHVHFSSDVVLDTCKWVSAYLMRHPREDFRADAPLPF